MRELISLLDTSNLNVVTYGVATVTAIQASAGTVTLTTGTRALGTVPYLLSYSPTVNDKVHLLISESTGMLVLGKSLAVAAPVAPTQRTAFLVPNASATWQEMSNPTLGADPPVSTPGTVMQGSDALYTYTGTYSYPTGQVTLVAKETIIRAELLVARIDDVHGTTVSPCLLELRGMEADGRPLIDLNYCYMPFDIDPGTVVWAPIPLAWCTHIISNASRGVAFHTLSAHHAFTISRYAPYNQVVFSTYTAGTIRLTIQKTA
jgi:hypothetical protein